MENLTFDNEDKQTTFSELDGENELRIDIDDGLNVQIAYLCVEQVVALKDYLIKQLNNL